MQSLTSPSQSVQFPSQSFAPPPESHQCPSQSLQPASTQSISLRPPVISAKYFPASEINRNNLKDIHQVIAANKKLCVPARASTLAVKLAREAVFGDETLAMCTVAGERGGYLALPVEEMRVLKTAMLHQFSTVITPVEFKIIWKECNDAIGQACKRARDKRKK